MGSDQLLQWLPEEVEVYDSDLYYAFSLHGTDYAQNLLLSEGLARLVEGRSFEQSEIDQGASVAMIFQPFAEVNDLHIGDDIVMNYSIVDYSAAGTEILEVIPVPLDIIGIIESILPEGQANSNGISDREINAAKLQTGDDMRQ